MNGTFFCDREPSSHTHAFGAERESGGHASAVRDAANSDHGNFNRINNRRNQNQRGHLAAVRRGFKARHLKSVRSGFLGGKRVFDRGDRRYDFPAVGVYFFD